MSQRRDCAVMILYLYSQILNLKRNTRLKQETGHRKPTYLDTADMYLLHYVQSEKHTRHFARTVRHCAAARASSGCASPPRPPRVASSADSDDDATGPVHGGEVAAGCS